MNLPMQPTLWESLAEAGLAEAEPDQAKLERADLSFVLRMRRRLRRRCRGAEPVRWAPSGKLRTRVLFEELPGELVVHYPRTWNGNDLAPWRAAFRGSPAPPARKTPVRGRGADVPAPELEARARQLAVHLPPLPAFAISWSPRLLKTWGLCHKSSGRIRIAAAAQILPQAALDYLLVHELAHLRVQSHGKRFHELVARVPGTAEGRRLLRAAEKAEPAQRGAHLEC